jgi:triosephosphate isomerase
MQRKMAAGNWKMNGTQSDLVELHEIDRLHASAQCDIVLCLPATLLLPAGAFGGIVQIGAQDCHAQPQGAYTGDISAAMIADAGSSHVILGHSERRTAYKETDAMVRDKAQAAHLNSLVSIICIGETLAEREAGQAIEVLTRQLAGSLPDGVTPSNTVVAYEPIWAIGTGHIPEIAQIAEVHAALRNQLTQRFGEDGLQIRLLYGGSVKPDNAAAIFATANVDGALVGGASLKARDFSPIIRALEAS